MSMQFKDHRTALTFRDWLRRVVKIEVSKWHPDDAYGLVSTINYPAQTAGILVGNSTTPVSQPFPATLQPTVGQYVRVGGRAQNRHIDAITTPPIWQSLTLDNGWGAGPSATPQAMRDPLGIVHLRGALVSGSAAVSAAELPVGMLPPQPYEYAVPTGATTFTRISVEPDGTIIPHDTTSSVRLDGISFDVNGGG